MIFSNGKLTVRSIAPLWKAILIGDTRAIDGRKHVLRRFFMRKRYFIPRR
jgi:hypothetical protein